ncbi:mRNA decay protein, partial [Coemansia helicoidea]
MDVVFDGPLAAGSGADGGGGGGGLWEDDEERVFYTSLVDLRSKIPSALLESGAKRQDPAGKAGKEQASSPAGDQAGPDEAADSAPDDGSGGDAALDDFDESAFEASLALDPADVGGPGDDGDDDADESQAALGILEYQRFIAQNQGDGAAGDGQGAGDAVGGGSPGPLLGGAGGADGRGSPRAAASPAVPEAPSEGMLTIVQQAGPAGGAAHMIASVSFAQLVRRLPTMTTKDDVDDAAVDFCYVNTRANRKALASVLLDAPRRQMFVIPLYARFLATLHPFFPDIGEAVVDELTRDFGWLVRKRVKGLLDAQLKNARYIAELTKFHVAPLHVAFRCARTLLEQFHVQNIEVLCALLDGCGRFLHAQPKTAARIEAILEILMRKRRVLNLDDRTILLIENAFNACQLHRARAARPEKLRTPYERYIRKLFYEDLAGDTVAAVCQLLRRLPWGDGTGDDPQRVRHALMCCFSKVWKIKHANLGLAAAALGALGCVHPWFRVAVVDAVAESIKLGLERSVFEHNQRRIAEVAYVGEMFGCGVVGPQVVLDLVRLLVTYGHRELPPQPGCGCELDPPSSYFRIRLVCTLLLACGSRLGSAAGPARMAELSLHLQMYILAKDHPLPVDIDYSVDNLFEAVFSQTPRFGSWGEAAQCAVSRAGQALPTPPAALATPENRAPSGEALTAAGSGLGATASGSTSPPGSGADADADGSDAESDDAASVVSDTDRLLAEMEEAQRQREALEALLDREEEDALEHEFNKLMLEASDLRRTDSASKLDVGIPMSLIGRPVMRPPSADRADGSGAAIRLSLLTGKKQRPVVHELDIPAA